jgi:hypothetical protein
LSVQVLNSDNEDYHLLGCDAGRLINISEDPAAPIFRIMSNLIMESGTDIGRGRTRAVLRS